MSSVRWGGDVSFCCWGNTWQEMGTRSLLHSCSAHLALSLLLGLSHGIWTKVGQLSGRVDCRQRGTSVLLAWLLRGAWLLTPQDGALLGHQVFPFWADHRAVLCLPGARAPETGSLELLFVLRGVLILRLESLAWVCLSCPCLSDTQVLRGGLLCGPFCSRGPLWRECP